MISEVKQEWLKALRSGKFQQAAGKLRKGQAYCCLGVLCSLHAKKHRVKWRSGQPYFENRICLPEEVVAWAGLEGQNPEVLIGGERVFLSDLNDNGLKFDAIAALIEEKIPG